MINPEKIDILTQSSYTLGKISHRGVVDHQDVQVLANLIEAYKSEILAAPPAQAQVDQDFEKAMKACWPPRLLNTEPEPTQLAITTLQEPEEEAVQDPDAERFWPVCTLPEEQPETQAPDSPAPTGPEPREQLPAVRSMSFDPKPKEPAPGMKACTKCKTPKPATEDNFRRDKRTQKLKSWCRDCERACTAASDKRRKAARQAAAQPEQPKPEPTPAPEPAEIHEFPQPNPVQAVLYVGPESTVFYIDEIIVENKPTGRWTLWKQEGKNAPICMRSVLEDRDYPTFEDAQLALDRFAQTQRQWKPARRRQQPAEQIAK